MRTCKTCVHFKLGGDFTRFSGFEKTGKCEFVNTESFPENKVNNRITYFEADHGGGYCVGENFGCIHHNEKEG